MDWKKVWELPLWNDECGYAWGANNTMALTFDLQSRDHELFNEAVDVINGVKEPSFDKVWSVKNGDIFYGDTYAFCVRGWGELTSPYCLALSKEEAKATQDAFAEYIIKKLNGLDK